MSSIPKKKQTVNYDFRIFDFREKTLYENNGNKNITKYVIIMYGINAKGETCYIEVNDHKPFFYIKVPDNFISTDLQKLKNAIWSEIKTQSFECDLEIMEMKKLYGFSGNRKHKFVKLIFQHINIFNRVKHLWGSNPYTCSSGEHLQTADYELYESNIPPLLRFFHINKISPSGWVRMSGVKRDKAQKLSQCTYGFKCSYKNIIPLPDKETPTPFKICSFDIEASSSHGDFPVPLKSYKKLATNIVDIFKTQEAVINESNSKQMLLKIINTAFGFDKVENVDVVYPKLKQTKANISKLFDEHIDSDVLTIKSKNWDNNDRKKYMVQNTEFLNPDEDIDNDVDINSNQTTLNIGEKKSCKVVKGSKDTLIQYLLHKTKSRDEKINVCDIVLTSILPDLKGDEVTFIGSTFMKYGENEPYLNHCIVKGGCTEVPGATIECVNDERSVLTNWTNIINQEDPDIIIGYNIFGFDYEFMFRRAQENNCEESFLRLSRSHTHNGDLGLDQRDVCGKIDKKTQKISFNGIENKQLVIASGEYDLKFYDIPGRLQIDMYSYFRRDFNLSSYKLDDVASSYISDSIKHYENTIDENGEEICELYSSNLLGLHVNDFIHIELVNFTVDYYQDGKKFLVKNIVKRNLKDKEYNVIAISGHQMFDPKKKLKWGVAKDDVTPQDIFRLTNGSDEDRAKVAKYCIQDCNLVHHLMNKIDVITGYIEMSNICSVPMSFLVFRGQGIKLTSFVAKKCREKNTLMPDLEKKTTDSGYEGAIVLPPKCKMYMDNPVACVDYSSLYPSSMISQNYSHDSKVWSKTYDLDGNLVEETGEKDASGKFIYDNLPGYEYIDIQFDVYEYRRPKGKPKAKAEKTKTGVKHCRWVQLPQGEKSIMPSILEELLKARKDTRKKAKLETDPFMQNILDKRQLGYKVTANSLYGQCGARTSTFYEKDVAASTTATGRMMIIYGRLIIEKVYGHRICKTANHGLVLSKAEYVYGDSVAKYTPMYVRVNGNLEIMTVEKLGNIYGNDKWVQSTEANKQTKEYCELSHLHIESWTDKGWTKLHRIIRHKLASHKKMLRVLTHTGVVDVTDDHSLVTKGGKEISPKDVNIGTELMHRTLHYEDINCDKSSVVENCDNDIELKKAKILGFFFGDGSCGNYNCPSGDKSSWALNNKSVEFINKYKQLCEDVFPDFEWKVYDTINSSNVYKLTFNTNTNKNKKEIIKNFRNLMYSDKNKIIPSYILNGSSELRQAFWEGLYDADGDKDKNGYTRVDQKSQVSAAHICWLANSLGYKTSINTRTDKPDIYRVTSTKSHQRKNIDAIKKLEEIEYDDYVYDLTTDNHHFAAGVGNMIVHNTDSVFFTFNLQDHQTGQPIRGEKALEITIELAKEAGELCSKFLKPPMCLEYEKTLMPFILLSKKRYVGILYEDEPTNGYLKYMGLSIKRRDSCDYLKDTYGEIINILMQKQNIEQAIEYLNNSLQRLIDGNVPMEKLSITRALKSDYKNPQQIGHWVLSDRIGKRDPGNKPKPGDRIKYLFIPNKDRKALTGNKIETPEYIIENNLNIDYAHYITNQLMKPLQQLFGLAVEEIWKMQNKTQAIRKYQREIQALYDKYEDDLELIMKDREKIASAKVKTLLFDKFLKIIDKQQTKAFALETNHSIESFMTRR